MDEVAGGGFFFEAAKWLILNLVWENKEEIWDFLTYNTTLGLENQQAHYDLLYASGC